MTNEAENFENTTKTVVTYEPVLGVDFYSFVKIFTNTIKNYRNSIADSK